MDDPAPGEGDAGGPDGQGERWSFRKRFRMARGSAINSESNRLELSEAEGGQVYIKADGSGAIRDSDWLALRGDGFRSRAEAREECDRWISACRVGLTGLGLAVDFYSLGSIDEFDDPPPEAADIETGERHIADEGRKLIFLSAPVPKFSYALAISGKRGQQGEEVQAAILQSHHRPVNADESLAVDLFALSNEQPNRVRLLLLVSAVEALSVPKGRDSEGYEHVLRLIELTVQAPTLPDADRASILAALENMKNVSIARSGKELIRRLVPEYRVGKKRADNFYHDCYNARSEFVHGNSASTFTEEQIGYMAAHLHLLVAALIAHSVAGDGGHSTDGDGPVRPAATHDGPPFAPDLADAPRHPEEPS